MIECVIVLALPTVLVVTERASGGPAPADRDTVIAPTRARALNDTNAEMSSAGSVASRKFAHRSRESFKMKCVLILLPLMLSGCADIAATLVGLTVPGLVARAPDVVLYHSAYEAHYAKSDYAVIRAESSLSEGVEAFFLVDGQPADAAGFVYSWFSFRGIFVSPGTHRIVIKTGDARFSLIEATVTARHTYRIVATKNDHAKLLRLWDETDGKDRRLLQIEVRNPPEAESFFEALRTFRVTPDSAVVIGDTPSINGMFGRIPRKIDRSVEEDVNFKALDGSESVWLRYPTEMVETRFVLPGTHQIVLSVGGLQFPAGLRIRTLPPVEAEFGAQHIYLITAKKTADQHVLQIWDETEGTDKRTLVKEFRFVNHAVTSTPP